MAQTRGGNRRDPGGAGGGSGPHRPENPYRFSFSFIEGWEKRLTKVILVGVAVGVLVVLGALGLGASFDGSVPDDDPRWRWVWGLLIAGTVVGGLGILVPLCIACLLGGLSIHRYGWIPGLLTFTGMVGTALAQGLAEYVGDWLGGRLTEVCLGTLVVGVLGFFLVGHLAKVPMRIGGLPVRGRDAPDGG